MRMMGDNDPRGGYVRALSNTEIQNSCGYVPPSAAERPSAKLSAAPRSRERLIEEEVADRVQQAVLALSRKTEAQFRLIRDEYKRLSDAQEVRLSTKATVERTESDGHLSRLRLEVARLRGQIEQLEKPVAKPEMIVPSIQVDVSGLDELRRDVEAMRREWVEPKDGAEKILDMLHQKIDGRLLDVLGRIDRIETGTQVALSSAPKTDDIDNIRLEIAAIKQSLSTPAPIVVRESSPAPEIAYLRQEVQDLRDIVKQLSLPSEPKPVAYRRQVIHNDLGQVKEIIDTPIEEVPVTRGDVE